MVKDPVCGCEIDEVEAQWKALSSEAGGVTYYFCSDSCKREFDLAPEGYEVPIDQMRASDDGMGGYPGAWE